MAQYFIINQAYGHLRSFHQMLGNWEPEKESLIVGGNMIGYGHNSYIIMHRLMNLKSSYPDKIFFLKGKQEQLFEKFINNPSLHLSEFLDCGGASTLLSFSEFSVGLLELRNPHYLLDTLFPDIDFSELTSYLNLSVPYVEMENSYLFSSERNQLIHLAKENCDKVNRKKILLLKQNDDAFKLDYLNEYFNEIINELDCEEDDFEPYSLGLLGQSNCVPEIEGYRMVDGEIRERFQIQSEN